MSFVKVVHEQERLVVPLGSGSEKVKNLVQRISMRFRAHTGKSADDLKIVQLTTDDGFLIDLEDLVQDAVLANSTVIAVDQNAWLKDQEQHLKGEWLYVERPDFSDSGVTHYLRIGLHTYGHLYITHTKNWKGPINHLELIPASRLLGFEKEGLFEIFNIESSDKAHPWQASAKFVVKQVGPAFVANAIVLILKSGSDPQPEVVVVQLKSEGQGLAMESSTVRQKALQYLPPAKMNHPPLAKDVVVGTSLGDAIPGAYIKSFEGNSSAVNDQTSTIKIEQIEPVALDETWRESNGTFFNIFHCPIRVKNTVSGMRTIVKVESTYLDKGGLEQEVAFTRLGTKSGRWDYRYQEPPYTIEISEGYETMCVRASIRVTSSQLEKHRRIHPQLPRPITIAFKFIDDDGKVATLKVEAGQEERPLKKQSNFEEDGKKVAWFIHADDPTCEERIWAYAHLLRESDKNNFIIAHSDGSSLYIREENLYRYGWDAAKEGKAEVPLDLSVDKEKGRFSVKFWLLVDLEKKLPYAIRTHIKSGESSVIAERLLPDFSVNFDA